MGAFLTRFVRIESILQTCGLEIPTPVLLLSLGSTACLYILHASHFQLNDGARDYCKVVFAHEQYCMLPLNPSENISG